MGRADDTLRIDVVYCPAGGPADLSELRLRPGACLRDAVIASGLLERHGLALQAIDVGIWGRTQPLDAPLRDRDRVEVYRPLRVDPKEARRLRYRRTRKPM